jgi:hypothetical protein
VPPCKGGDLVVDYPDGSSGTEFILWPDAPGYVYPPTPNGQEEFMSTEDLQRALNDAGVTDSDDEPLAEDDDYGPKTHSAFVKALRQQSFTIHTGEVVTKVEMSS